MELTLKNTVSIAATLTNILLFLSGIQIIWKIYQRSSSQGFSILPFMACFVSCTLWLRYGVISKDFTMIFVNLIGSIIEGIYVIIFYLYTKQKKSVHPTVFGLLAFLTSVLAYSQYGKISESELIRRHGLVCASFNVINYAAPLGSAASVIKMKSTKNMSFVLSFVYFIVSIEWYFYGYLHKDNFIKVPNMFGIFLGIIQLSLFVFYPTSKSRVVEPKKQSVSANMIRTM
uniref:Sugar transporter SWEET n=1 Tax=Phallusia mammillata TaxID=59560 RepID=A0A6F9DS71_9ASCI|nr:sugar transporter SWEET1-like [Phallusia mammillata]